MTKPATFFSSHDPNIISKLFSPSLEFIDNTCGFCFQNAEYIKEIDEAYELALELVKSDGWKKEKYEKETVCL